MKDIEEYQKRFQNEVMTAAWSFYVWKSINNVASQDKAIHEGMNKHALVWNAMTHSLQTTYLVTLGRIFDMDHGALSIHSFLNKCIAEIQQFGPDELRTRKIRLAGGSVPPWLANYMAEAQHPSKEDFRALKRQAKRFQKQYEEIYKPIRNKVVAHKEIAAIPDTAALFAKTRIGDIQKTLEFLNGVSEVVFEWLHNGRRTELSDHVLNEEIPVLESVSELMAKIRI